MRTFIPAQLDTRWARVAAEIERSRSSLGVDEVHDLRVALRRYNEALRLFEPWTGKRYSRKLRKQIRSLRRTAGELRDLDVAAELLAKAGSSISLAERREETAARVREALAAAIPTPPAPVIDSGDRAADVARTMLPKVSDRYFRKGAKLQAGEPGDERLHAFRIDGKHFRYTLEMFAPLYGPALGRRLGSLREIQQALGDFHDCFVLAAMEETRDDGQLKAWLRERAEKKRREFHEVWRTGFGSAENWATYLRRWAREPGAMLPS